jgi:hypothetical protein
MMKGIAHLKFTAIFLRISILAIANAWSIALLLPAGKGRGIFPFRQQPGVHLVVVYIILRIVFNALEFGIPDVFPAICKHGPIDAS